MLIQRIRNMAGFTLIELMIVIAIVCIMAAIIIPNIIVVIQKQKVQKQEQDSRIKESEQPTKLPTLKVE